MIKQQAIQEVKSLTEKYTSNTSLVAAVLATITFAAAFTLPEGFSTNPADSGQPIFARKAAFQAFLISDTITMCSSLAVAFLCILVTWEDLDFLLNYRKTTRVLMWCAYKATAVAFGTGFVHSDGVPQLVSCNSYTGTLHHPSTPLQDHR